MLFPQNNRCRTVLDLSGIWEMRLDPDDQGIEQGWTNGFKSESFIGVPGSWNEQLAEMGLMNYVGSVWYKTEFMNPKGHSDRKVVIRFGSADYNARVWINGQYAGEHFGGYMPFEFDVTGLIHMDQKNSLIVRVNNTLNHKSIPQGLKPENYEAFGKNRERTFPITGFDFFAYGGIQRPVKVIYSNSLSLDTVQCDSTINGNEGILSVLSEFSGPFSSAVVQISVWDGESKIASLERSLDEPVIENRLIIKSCRHWSPETPFLYQLRFEIRQSGELIDEYVMDVGFREIHVQGSKLILNGKPIFLKGFGKHEDFAVLGKGLSYPLIVKDFRLMEWIGANSFRTSHYPYAEEIMQLADRMGFLVIDEVPAVSLNFRYVTDETLKNHKKVLTDLIARDRNHPSVICWSVANEPGIWGEEEAALDDAKSYWKEIFNHVRSLDHSRPVILPACVEWKDRDLSFQFSDIVSVNRYWGWYELPADIEEAGDQLKADLIRLYQKYRKPLFVSEFGADTIEGAHATYPQLFTEEYQTQLILKYFEVIESLPFVIGEHVWNFADFRTPQHHRRVILNRKGVFNRQRDPKSAAFAIRKHWLVQE